MFIYVNIKIYLIRQYTRDCGQKSFDTSHRVSEHKDRKDDFIMHYKYV